MRTVGVEHDAFAHPVEPGDGASDERLDIGSCGTQEERTGQPYAEDGASNQPRAQGMQVEFDVRQFRHGRILAGRQRAEAGRGPVVYAEQRMDRAGWVILGAVAAGSALGGVARHLLTEAVVRIAGAGFPWGTLLVNVSGSLAIGVLTALAGIAMPASWPPVWRHAAITGVLGGFTTFSTFSVQTVALLQQGLVLAALANAALSVGLGIGACWAGFVLASALSR